MPDSTHWEIVDKKRNHEPSLIQSIEVSISLSQMRELHYVSIRIRFSCNRDQDNSGLN